MKKKRGLGRSLAGRKNREGENNTEARKGKGTQSKRSIENKVQKNGVKKGMRHEKSAMWWWLRKRGGRLDLMRWVTKMRLKSRLQFQPKSSTVVTHPLERPFWAHRRLGRDPFSNRGKAGLVSNRVEHRVWPNSRLSCKALRINI